jgi:hypothetical protein
VTSDTITEPVDGQPTEFGARVKFHEVFQKEVALINQRRARVQAGKIELQIEALEEVTGEPVLAHTESAKVVGLALSGGGIRSAAFCLGVLQALDVTRVLDRVDYLSTVSGGGYVGCSLTVALESIGRTGNAPEFPFSSRLMEDETAIPATYPRLLELSLSAWRERPALQCFYLRAWPGRQCRANRAVYSRRGGTHSACSPGSG